MPYKNLELRKECNKRSFAKWYSLHKDKVLLRNKIRKKRDILDFENYKKTLKCSICDESRFWTLDFHHLDPATKEGTMSTLCFTVSKKKLQLEIDKCIVLCSNCHRDLHYNEKINKLLLKNKSNNI